MSFADATLVQAISDLIKNEISRYKARECLLEKQACESILRLKASEEECEKLREKNVFLNDLADMHISMEGMKAERDALYDKEESNHKALQAVRRHHQDAIKERDAALQTCMDITKRADDAIKEHDVVIKERDAVVQTCMNITKRADDAIKERDVAIKEHETLKRQIKSIQSQFAFLEEDHTPTMHDTGNNCT